jgi:hypothetical protein
MGEYIVTYLSFSNDGSHSRPMKASFQEEADARATIADMVAKHESEPPYNDHDMGYRMTLLKNGKVIFEKERGIS